MSNTYQEPSHEEYVESLRKMKKEDLVQRCVDGMDMEARLRGDYFRAISERQMAEAGWKDANMRLDRALHTLELIASKVAKL